MSNNRRFIYGLDGRVFTSNGKIFDFVSAYPPMDDMQLWLMADTGVITDLNDKVTEWQDQSGNGFNALQSSEPLRPLLVQNVLNAKPVLQFDGAQFMTNNFVQTFEQPITVFTVWSVNLAGDFIAWDNLSGGRFFLYKNGSLNNIRINAENVSLGYPKSDGAMPHLLSTSVFDGMTSQQYENGAFQVEGNASTGGCNGLNIGRLRINSLHLNGDIAEIIFYDRLLSEPERQSVEQYLLSKYAL